MSGEHSRTLPLAGTPQVAPQLGAHEDTSFAHPLAQAQLSEAAPAAVRFNWCHLVAFDPLGANGPLLATRALKVSPIIKSVQMPARPSSTAAPCTANTFG